MFITPRVQELAQELLFALFRKCFSPTTHAKHKHWRKRGNLASNRKVIKRDNQRPSIPALALATSITPEIYIDTYRHAEMIDMAFDNALEAARAEEQARIFGLGFVAIVREFWKGRKLYHA